MDAFPIDVVPLRRWLQSAPQILPCPLPPLRIASRLELVPAITVEHDVLVTGSDFIPIRADGTALLEQAVHTPSIFLDKKGRSVGRDAQGNALAHPGRVRPCDTPCLLVGGSTNYYHWLVDYLPRLLMADEHMSLAGLKLLVNEPLAPFQRETLELLGFRSADLMGVAPGESLRVRRLVMPTLLATTTVPHPAVVNMLRAAFPPRQPATASPRLYLQRQDAPTRRLVNHAALSELLQRHGVATRVPGAMSFQAQVDACAGAQVIVAVHGAGMANTLFCRPGTQVLEISSPERRVTSMALIARQGGLRHRFLDARVVTRGADGNPLLGDWEADLPQLGAALQALD